MKLPIFSLLLFFLIAASNVSCGVVLDMDGNLIIPGSSSYYVLPYVWDRKVGGLNISSKATSQFDDVQELDAIRNGLPVKFFMKNPKAAFIPENMDLNIEFDFKSSLCSRVWKIGKSRGKRRVTICGLKGNPGAETINSWFKVVRAIPHYYKFVYCPSVCPSCEPVCGDVGIDVGDDGQRHLVISDTPFVVMFEKVRACRSANRNRQCYRHLEV